MSAVWMPPGKQVFIDLNGNPLVGGLVYFYVPSTDTLKDTWQDPDQLALNTNPVVLDALGSASIWGDGSYRQKLVTALGVELWDRKVTMGATSADQISFIQAGAGTVERDVQTKLREVQVSITDFGGVEGLATDNTAAFNAALACLGENGGTIYFPPGDWRGDFVVNQDAVLVASAGGVGETNLACLRPWTTGAGSAALQFSDGTRVNRRCGIRDIAINDDDGFGNHADMTLALFGGTVHFSAFRFGLMGNNHSLHIEPSGGLPVTTCWFSHYDIRCDGASAGSAAIWSDRKADPEYNTGIYFAQGHINGPTAGAVIKIDGTLHAVRFFMQDTYIDQHPAAPIWLLGSAAMTVDNVQCDPGAVGEVVVQTDQANADPARYIDGKLNAGGQIFRCATGDTLFPSDGGACFYQPRLSEAYVGALLYFVDPTAPYRTTTYLDMATATGPFRVNGMDFKASATTQTANPTDGAISTPGGLGALKDFRLGGIFHLYGGNGVPSATLNSVGAGGGIRIDTTAAAQDIQFRATGGNVETFSDTLRPGADGAGTLGDGSHRWSEVFALNPVINTSDGRYKRVRGGLEPAELAAWARVQFRVYQWLDAIDAKGDGARLHAGLIAQEVAAAFEAEHLDPHRYALFCADEIMESVPVPRQVTRPVIEMVEVEALEYEETESGAVLRRGTKPVERTQTVVKLVVDEHGEPVMYEKAAARPAKYDIRGQDVVCTAPAVEAVMAQRTAEFPVMETVTVYDEVHQPTGETRLGLRYTECLIFEAAYQRTLVAALAARMDAAGIP